MYGETTILPTTGASNGNPKRFNLKFTAKYDVPMVFYAFMPTCIADTEIGSLKSLHALISLCKYLYHSTTVKIEQNCMVQTTHNFQ